MLDEDHAEPLKQAQTSARRVCLVRVNGHEMTLFPDGRAIVKGTKDADQARSLYAKYFGC